MAVSDRPPGDDERTGVYRVAVGVCSRRALAERAQAHEADVGRAVEIVGRQDVGRGRARRHHGERDANAGEADDAGEGSHRGEVLGKPIRWMTWYSVGLPG